MEALHTPTSLEGSFLSDDLIIFPFLFFGFPAYPEFTGPVMGEQNLACKLDMMNEPFCRFIKIDSRIPVI